MEAITDIVKARTAVVTVMGCDPSGDQNVQGTGFFISADGRVVTNYHVIENVQELWFQLHNGGFLLFEGFLATDEDQDLAVLKVDAKEMPFLKLGDSDKVKQLDDVVAIGTPKGLEGTISKGIVSALREHDGEKFIQTDTAISSGSSGGPLLLESSGEVIGVNTFGIAGGENLNFAVPINTLKPHLVNTKVQSQFAAPDPDDPKEMSPDYGQPKHDIGSEISKWFRIFTKTMEAVPGGLVRAIHKCRVGPTLKVVGVNFSKWFRIFRGAMGSVMNVFVRPITPTTGIIAIVTIVSVMSMSVLIFIIGPRKRERVAEDIRVSNQTPASNLELPVEKDTESLFGQLERRQLADPHESIMQTPMFEQGTNTLDSLPFDYFTVGSTINEVEAVQGSPTNATTTGNFTTYYYGSASVDFKNGKVVKYSNVGRKLKIQENQPAVNENSGEYNETTR